MVFYTILILVLMATYFMITSGMLHNIRSILLNSNAPDSTTYVAETLLPGMLGSEPSDQIDVYDSKRPITIPTEGAITTLLSSYKDAANQVYVDFKNNNNSVKYKEYIFNDYKLELLKRNNSLTDDQLNSYFITRNTVGKDINNIFNYYLDKIKYSADKSYFIVRREILNDSGTSLLINEQTLDSISNYVLSNTRIPGEIIILLKHKVTLPTQELIDQITMLAGFNYTTVLSVLEQVLIREPLPGISLLGIVNSASTKMVGSIPVVVQGFWTQVYFAFKASNIDNYLISFIKLSFMNEYIYRAILSSLVAQLQKPYLTESINIIIGMCWESESKIIRMFPYNFTHSLLVDAIRENRNLLISNKSINVTHIDKESSGISNIEYYSNLEQNFPVSVQPLKTQPLTNNTVIVDYIRPIYPVLSSEYMINNYLSFPSIVHAGVYFDRTDAVPVDASGYIMITNTSTLTDLTISSFIIYAALQDNFVTEDKKDISFTVMDNNIVNNSALITVESGRYLSPNFTDILSEPVTTNWLSGSSITIPAFKSIRIRATKQSSVISLRFLRIYAILIPFVNKPAANFLQISIVHDRASAADLEKFDHFQFQNIPAAMPNILATFDSPYNITSLSARTTDTFKIFNDNLTGGFHSRLITTGATSTDLISTLQSGQVRTSIISSTGSVIDIPDIYSTTGLVTDTRSFSVSNPNSLRSSYRIKLRNGSTTPVVINKMIVFGNISSTPSFNTNVPNVEYMADDNILLRNTLITAFTMSADERTITQSNVTGFIIDPLNPIATSYVLNAGSSIYIEPTVSSTTSLSSRFINVRAIYVELAGVDKSLMELTIISLNPLVGSNKYATLPSSVTPWTNDGTFIVLNPIGSTAAVYSNFSITPEYKKEPYNILPKYKVDTYQSDPYDEYYDPVSELIQYPSNFY